VKLAADGRLCQVKLAAGPRDGALSSDRPEVQQMMIIEPVHDPIIHRFFL